ncbi:MarR family transcriptional regulator [Galbitalea soli]|uniref:MarR family transcriptional regulator n=1 Tax=Galbitalea soli TaxID=1268042 RepID=A0A7C9TU90_9MICO|nr:MarR family transcriptional regulator [Galbitalea soli]NYJ29561.1 DNA-binding MarR family transcriptional regulator [Galbitalea soli]
MPTDDQDIRLTIQRLARRIRSMQGDENVTEGQRAVLFALYTLGPQSLSSLSEHERVTPPSMNRTINSLVAAGLVTREAARDDGRRVVLELSDAGRTFIRDTKRKRDAWFTTRLASLSEEERATVAAAADILRKLADS